MTYSRIDPKTRRLIVSDLTPPIRRMLSSLSTLITNNKTSINKQEEKNFITDRVIKSILFSLWQEVDWDKVDLWDIDWEEWIEPVVLESVYNEYITAMSVTQNDNRILMFMGM